MMKDIKLKYPILYKSKIDNLNKVANFAYINTCRRKYILEYFNESCNFFTCNNCDNCCENELVDMTDKFWSLLMKQKPFYTIINEIRNEYLTDITENNKELDLTESLQKWKYHILKNKINQTTISDNLKIRIPKKFIKNNQTKKIEESFESKINLYEKYL